MNHISFVTTSPKNIFCYFEGNEVTRKMKCYEYFTKDCINHILGDNNGDDKCKKFPLLQSDFILDIMNDDKLYSIVSISIIIIQNMENIFRHGQST